AIARTSPPQILIVPTGPGEPKALPRQLIKDYLWAYWLPDGKRILVNGAEEGRGLRSYTMDLAGGAPRPVTPEGAWCHHLSHDGRLMAATGGGEPVTLPPIHGGPSPP